MKRLSVYCILLIAALAGCSRETIDVPGEKAAPLVISFGSESNVTVLSRSTLGDYPENRVHNIYIAVFNSEGQKVYTHFFDADNLKAKAADVESATDACWYVSNTTDASNSRTTGCIKIPVNPGTGYTLYGISNLDADMVNVSSDRLGAEITAEADLKDFVVTLNQNVISRNGYFPMSGVVDGVTVDNSGYIKADGNTANLQLRRMDAKVRFVFQTGTTPDANGQVIKSFTPGQWKVVNIPRKTYVLPYAERGITATAGYDAGTTADDFFASNAVQFEKFPTETRSEFSFYMLENRMTPKKTAAKFADRDRQVKTAEGLNGEWEYANDLSTYVVVTGRVEMDLVNDDAGQTLGGEVQYIIHLGDFGTNGSPNDFSTHRNTSYTYTVTVNSVNNIRVEVDTETTENQPGATGTITIAKEEIALCDAHYVAKTLTFHAKHITDDLTWYVKTPFCDGKPQLIEGEDVPTGLDYKWCHFRLNEKNTAGNYYENRRRKYTPDAYDAVTNPGGEMDIITLVKYIKAQKKLYDDPLRRDESAFDNTPEADGGPKICLTVHVDEYYYDAHPITGEKRTTLWKEFVNQPDRMMHILCNSNISKDQESRSTGSVVTIQQKSIQSIFDTRVSNTSFSTAWGMEHKDEYPDIWTYGKGVQINSSGVVSPSENRGNNELYNGRLNTMREWGLVNANGTTFDTEVPWDRYMAVEVENDIPELSDEYRYLRYSCMTRNRDNNGNGKIDQDEVRWYLASIRQLVGVWIGADVIDHDGRLYNRTATEMDSNDEGVWRQHIISSTAYADNSNNPTVVWSEEGSATGDLGGSYVWSNKKVTRWSVRCVRNLGTANETKTEGYDLTETPNDYIDVTENTDGSYTFDNINLNQTAMRYYTSRELDYDDELSEQNRVYKKFEAAPSASAKTFGATNFQNMNDAVSKQSTNPYCPPGYRLPNQRELTLMRYYIPANFWSGTPFTRTYYSMGSLTDGKYKGKTNRTGYGYSGGNIFLDQGSTTTTVRCVKDIYSAD
ncbi:DUF4906 domain-containing protein [Butyricimonas sp.]|uniref:fimbrial protein n=1 Tax=Butyricimonas sp. TaxID=1969738 RepID=UPI0025BE026A|nr:DUF4906 domain-containing protein [Butyricimonas sp.]